MAASEILLNAVFYVFAAAAIGGALAVAASRNIVRSAFSLLAVLFSVAALYALMKADFLAAAQILIYVGGILVLIIFAVMLTHRITDVNVSNESTPGPAAVFAVLCLFVALAIAAVFTWKWERAPEAVSARAGATEVLLLQYQSDGKTGLAPGGATHEPAVVLVLRGPASIEGATVEFEVAAVPGWSSPRKASARVSGGEARATVDGLPASVAGKGNAMHWRARIGGTDAATRPDADDPNADFRVYKGLTEPAALALSKDYLFAFEVVSVLLLAALVGAAFLARKEVKEA
jgi:NADH:ubiquinone oxidoreductase subunit 6 (subunit J)